jgi:DUF1680 family protein
VGRPGEWTLSLRGPGWAEGAGLRVAGKEQAAAAGSYVAIRRAWQPGDTVELVLPMTVRIVEADERIDAVRGCVALERGPLVYAVEQVDLPDGVSVDDLRLDVAADTTAEFRPDLLGGVTVITTRGRADTQEHDGWPYRAAGQRGTPKGTDVPVVAVPYYAWANRGIGPMRVWLPRA